MHYLATPLLYREVRLRGVGHREKGKPATTTAQGSERAEDANGERKRKRKRDRGDSGDGGDEFQVSFESTSCPCAASTMSGRGMSVFLVGLATLQRPTVSRVVRKLVLEGELEVGSFGNISDIYSSSSSTGTESTRRTLEWSEGDGMFGLAVGGAVGSLTDLQELR